MKAILYSDGSKRIDPPRAGYGYVILDINRKPISKQWREISNKASCNYAEYVGLIEGMKESLEIGVTDLEANTDSRLVVMQVQGSWTCLNRRLRKKLFQVLTLAKKFDRFVIRWVSRDKNGEADFLASLSVNDINGS